MGRSYECNLWCIGCYGEITNEMNSWLWKILITATLLQVPKAGQGHPQEWPRQQLVKMMWKCQAMAEHLKTWPTIKVWNTVELGGVQPWVALVTLSVLNNVSHMIDQDVCWKLFCAPMQLSCMDLVPDQLVNSAERAFIFSSAASLNTT